MDKLQSEEVQIFARSVATELNKEELETVSGGGCGIPQPIFCTVWTGPLCEEC